MDVLVTGGAGFIGSYIADTLSRQDIESGHRIHVLDNLSAGKRTHVPNSSLYTLYIRSEMVAR